MRQLGLVVATLGSIAILAGCGKKDNQAADTGESMILTTSNSTGQLPCQCSQSNVVTVSNPDTETRYADVEISVFESATNNPVNKTSRKFVLDSKKSEFAGCNVDQYPSCKFKVAYRITSEARLKVSNSAIAKSFGPFYAPDINTCYAICNDPNDSSCLRLGAQARQVTQPIVDLYLRTISSAKKEITASEIAAEYKQPTTDECQRGSVFIENDVITNESVTGKGCRYTTSSSLTLAGSQATMSGFIPNRLVGQRVSSFRIAGASGVQEHLRYDDRDLAPKVTFDGTGGTELTSIYGGSIRTMSVVGDSAYFATANGCMSAPTK
ncbi:hypothetical protein [Methylosinus sporium]|uniref:hypothetical protein n=1 Tax=Methylosinus sporium TaxID=428 RepID=UPI000D59F53A|nr:hypothetical protein [Methylosinus sporium]PWB88709.1 hypothetical protein C5688_19820 [Methylocystis sp. MitZ-2018]